MHIVPQRLRRLRKKRNLSRQDLATHSTVSLKQIQRLENPKQASANVRPHTLRCLAEALGVEPQELTGEPPVPEDSKTVRIGAALLPGVRLAYELIERRYGVTVGHILNAAPLYFALLAEASLAWRRTELAELQAAINRVQEIGDFRRKRFAFHAWHAENDSGYEEEAIARGDLFGDPLSAEYEFAPDDDWDGSPFADYLRKFANDLGRPELVDLDASSHGRIPSLPGLPAYRIYTEELRRLAPIDSRAMYALHSGDARISDIPDELMADDAEEHRRKWLEEQLSPQSRQWLDDFAELIASIRLDIDGNSDTAAPEGSNVARPLHAGKVRDNDDTAKPDGGNR